MARVITAPEPYEHIDTVPSMFLAGAIDMGAAINWQADVIKKMTNIPNFLILNPRRAQFTPHTLDEQINWELSALSWVDYIFMWFPSDARAPIAFFEAGLYWKSGKLIVGVEKDFYRQRNLEMTARFYGVFLHTSLAAMIEEVRNRLVLSGTMYITP